MSWYEIDSSFSCIAAQKTLHRSRTDNLNDHDTCWPHSLASLPCWHRAARRLLRKAAELVQPPVVEITEAELQALVDELYA